MQFDWPEYLTKDIWRVDLSSVSKGRALWIRFLRTLILISQGFTKSQIQQGASTLTYYSLLGLVPFIALLLGISRGFNIEGALKEWILKRFIEQKEVMLQLFDFAESSLKTAHQGIIAGAGILLLLWAGIKIFLYIETVMNTIWEVSEGRKFARRFTDYLAMMFLCPLFIFLASGITVYLSGSVATLTEETIFSTISPLLFSFLNLIPVVLTCLLFTFLYIFMPNTHVRFFPALWAGLIAGSLYQIIQWVYLYFQIGVSSYNAIYGTFAALPLFLIWIHLSWVIILLGAKMTFAFQNVHAFDFLSEDVPLSNRFRTLLSLRITHLIVKDFCNVIPPPSPIEISNKLSIPLPLVGHLLHELTTAGVLSEVKRDTDEDSGYQPARNVDQLTIKSVIDMINTRGEEILLPSSPELELILNSLDKFDCEMSKSDGNVLLKNI